MSEHDQPQNGLATERLATLVPKLAVPTVVAQIVSLLYNIVDRMFIGHIPEIGVAALAGVGVCFPIIGIVLSFANWVGAGGGPTAAAMLGKRDLEGAPGI